MLASRKSPILALVFVLVLSLVLVLVGCSESKAAVGTSAENKSVTLDDTSAEQGSNLSQIETSQPPKQEESTNIVRISDILTNPDVYKGQAVVVKGKIISECPAGCWFTLNDGTGTIYVDLNPSNLVIPQKRGATATVYGEVIRASGHTYIIGKKVEF
ncbi:MAG: hypothetical protein FJ006_01325 [Chloroflexi bacterium]|nr:hypothetical protein [Chloroflexota bacterium]